ncbi:MAG TPA: alcohol dehydrogenase catalytic domain-containing protein [Gaiellaceae bacterium]
MKTRAALFHGAGRRLGVREIDLREPRPREVLVRLRAVGICGTDLHVIKGEWERPQPMVLGHEGAGTVEAVGPEVESPRPGDAVVLSWAPSCGACADCGRGRPAACLDLQRAIGNGTLLDGTTGLESDGDTVYRGTATGALSELLTVDAAVALPLRADIPFEQAALLGCAALTGVGAVLFQARPEPGATVVVVGAGGVGQFCVQGARIAGAAEIVCVDPVEGRRRQAARLGATRTAPPEGLPEVLQEVAPDGADVAVDAVGAPETTALALRWTRNGGRTVLVGLPAAGERLDLDPAEFTRREKELTGSMYGSEDPRRALPVLLEHVRSRALELEPLVGTRFPLDDVNDAIEASLAGAPGRVLVLP